MADITSGLMAAAGSAGGGALTEYIAVGGNGIRLFTHEAGTLSLASTYTPFATAVSLGVNSATEQITSNNGASPYVVAVFSYSGGTLTQTATYTLSLFANSVTFNSDATYIAGATPASQGCCNIYDHTTPGTLTRSATYSYGTANIVSAAFTPDDAYVAFGDNDRTVTMFSFSAGSITRVSSYTISEVSNGTAVNSITFDNDGSHILFTLAATSPGLIIGTNTSGTLARTSAYGYSGNGRNVVFTSDDAYVAVHSSNQINFYSWNGSALTYVSTYTGGSFSVPVQANFSPNDDYYVYPTQTNISLLNFSAGTATLALTYAAGISTVYAAKFCTGA